uniref:Putative secreted protein n=1 Tax=Anopheles triannulatus TaxID=58253 RepID=A0A2M4B180_9DIPT
MSVGVVGLLVVRPPAGGQKLTYSGSASGAVRLPVDVLRLIALALLLLIASGTPAPPPPPPAAFLLKLSSA